MTISPLYTISQYRADMYKVVAFKRSIDPDAIFLHLKEEENHYDTKLDNNISRARSMVLQYALCNPWTYFFTGTIDPAKFDRFDLDTYMGRLSQWIRDKRKAYNAKFQVLLVPEHHKDGAYHVHGLVHDLPEASLANFGSGAPESLRKGGFLNWPDYQAKFGYCSLAQIRDPIAVSFYITKYISKDLGRRVSDLGKHLYFHSRPLRTAVKASDVYLPNSGLDRLCTHDYDFCKTGMVKADWTFPLIWEGAEFPDKCSLFEPSPFSADPLDGFDPQTVEPPAEVWEQASLWA